MKTAYQWRETHTGGTKIIYPTKKMFVKKVYLFPEFLEYKIIFSVNRSFNLNYSFQKTLAVGHLQIIIIFHYEYENWQELKKIIIKYIDYNKIIIKQTHLI